MVLALVREEPEWEERDGAFWSVHDPEANVVSFTTIAFRKKAYRGRYLRSSIIALTTC